MSGFDWGLVSSDYARYRDIYPKEFYEKIAALGIGTHGQRVLDLGTGTGVLPRNMYPFGAQWTGTDISPEQIAQAQSLAGESGMDIRFFAAPAEETGLEDGSFDAVTACQCFWYFDHERLMPELRRMLKPGGKVLVIQMMWLPFEDEIAGKSEELILKYNPGWTGCGETRKPVWIPECAEKWFSCTARDMYDITVPFTRESWHGRIRACRGTGVSMSPETLALWEKEHISMLETWAPERFTVLHYVSLAVLTKRG